MLAKPQWMWGALRAPRDAAAGQPIQGGDWTAKSGPLMTPWAKQIDPNMPHPEYPRPQLVRHAWMNLNGLWEFQPSPAADEAPPFGKTLSGKILVPFPVESALSGVMEHYDRLWYRRFIRLPDAWTGKRILLHFDAVDYESEVFVNGRSVGLHRGGYDPFCYDITGALQHGESNELIVRVFDPTENGGQPRGKQVTRPHGIMYTPTTGIWQTVWIEPVDSLYIADLTMNPDIDRAALNLTVAASDPSVRASVKVQVKAHGKTVSSLTSAPNREFAVPVPAPRLWSPDDPFLYTIEIALEQDGRLADAVTSYFAMRKTHVGLVDGEKKLLLNNKFVFQIGPLDQGFWPDGIYTPPTDEAIKNEIMQMKAMGFNMVRKHIKVEPARWYYWTDTLGLMVWQDMPSCNSYPGREFVLPPEDKEAFASELARMVKTHRNVPSIVLWSVFNEGQGQFDTEKMVQIVKALDATRPVNEASGGRDMGFGDVDDIHSYPEPAVRPSTGARAMACGEFGGIGYLIPAHSWSGTGNGYVEVDTPADLLYLYAEFFQWVRRLRDKNNLSAVVYTQLTDVMTEVNGLLTYDRIAKIPVEQIRRVNTFTFPAPGYKDLLPTSAQSAQQWKYSLRKPDGDWTSLAYDDTHWLTGPAGFGNIAGHPGTAWSTQDLWLRRQFHPGALTAADLENLVLTELHQGTIEVFINGTQNYTQRGNNRSFEEIYEHRPLSDAARKAIVPNADNLIAVHCTARGAKQYFDAGLSIRIPSV